MLARPAYDERSKVSCTPTKPADCEQSEQNATVIAAIFQRTSLSSITDSLKQQFSNSPDIVTVSVAPTALPPPRSGPFREDRPKPALSWG